jgi:cellulose 1,4-beta-cellobiosidase
MRMSTLAAGLAATGFVAAAPFDMKAQALHKRVLKSRQESNPWVGKSLLANPSWGAKLESAYDTFIAAGDDVNAGKVRTIQGLGTFYWVSNIASLPLIDQAIADARAAKEATGEDQIIGLVLYNLPDRDCSAGESAGELSSANGGMARYKAEFVDPYFERVSAATDVSFAIVLEPDSLANLVTNMGIEFCAQAEPVYKEGIAYAISKLQLQKQQITSYFLSSILQFPFCTH